MSENINDASSYALDHHHHRQRLRKSFQQSQGSDMTDISLLELLYNGYYPRNETNAIARERLAAMSLSDRVKSAAESDISSCTQEDLFMATCARMIVSSNHGENLPPDFVGLHMKHLDPIFQKLYPYFLSDSARMVYLGFNRHEELHWGFFSVFGEEELPIALSHCHLKQLKYVILCISVDSIKQDQLFHGLRYYLRKIQHCPRIWELRGILLQYGSDYTYIPVSEEKKPSGGML